MAKDKSIKADFQRLFSDIQGEENIIFSKAEYNCYELCKKTKVADPRSITLYSRGNGKLYTYGEWAQIVGKMKIADVRFCDVVNDFRAIIGTNEIEPAIKTLQLNGYIVSLHILTKEGYLYKREKENYYRYKNESK